MRVHSVTLIALKETLVHANLSETIINRLSIYMHYLAEQEKLGKELVSSYDIAQVCGVTAGLVRKDLARFGKFGVKGVGYDVTGLCEGIKGVLGLDHTLHIAIIGMEDLGSYLLSFKEFLNGNYEIVAAFDTKPETPGMRRTAGMLVDVNHLSRLREVNEAQQIDIAIITTIPSEAQEATDRAVEAGIRGILNFTPSYVQVPKGFIVKNIHFVNVQDSLVYFLQTPRG
jgi:redox-sensing transcriptional repressor